jgi:hypothetical protein
MNQNSHINHKFNSLTNTISSRQYGYIYNLGFTQPLSVSFKKNGGMGARKDDGKRQKI